MRLIRPEDKSVELALDENDELKRISHHSYLLSLYNEKERELIQPFICEALIENIEVYEVVGFMSKLEICADKIVGSKYFLMEFSTSNIDKFERLKDIVRNIMIMVKNNELKRK